MKPDEKPQSAIPEFDSEIPENAVRLYGQTDAMDDFPVLKAFQQYIDSEQAKARKRMLLLCVFFGAMMVVVIAVFLMLLLSVSSRNQALSDRLFEYAIKERERTTAPIVVHPQQQQDNSAILALTAKIEEMQKNMNQTVRPVEEVRRQPETPHPTSEQIEIKRLSALLAAEKEKRAAEKARREAELERQRQIDLEEYRRKHYPDLYKPKNPKRTVKPDLDDAHAELLREVDQILSDDKAISYYDEEPAEKASPPPAPKKEYSIPVDIRGSSSRWSIPDD